jgi:hypothetical protein
MAECFPETAILALVDNNEAPVDSEFVTMGVWAA